MCVTLLLVCWPLLCRAAGTLDFYFMDVEEGNATLIVSPTGEVLLVDGGSPGPENRDARRFLAVAKQIGIKQIDYLVVTHYHGDHYGATPEISRHMRVVNWVDHGPGVESDKDQKWKEHWQIGVNEKLYSEYLEARAGGKHIVVKAGDRIPAGGINVQVVSSAGKMITSPLPGAGDANGSCRITPLRSEDETEDGQSIGMLISFGKFRYVFLGDLTWNKARQLFCPRNLIGAVDVYETTHHGMSIERTTSEIRWGRSCCGEAEVHGLHPRVTILNSGERYHKLGTPRAWQVIHNSPGLEDFWQLHYEAGGGKENNVAEQYIANLSAANCQGHWIKLSASADGAFTVTNTRNGLARNYSPHK
jgi:competence protein ComEC